LICGRIVIEERQVSLIGKENPMVRVAELADLGLEVKEH